MTSSVLDTRTIEFAELWAIRHVAHAGSLSAAAEKLGVSKSVVSKYVARFEARVSSRMFERTTRKVQPTRLARSLLPRIESLLEESTLLVEDARAERAHVAGLVRIAATPELGGAVAHALAEELPRRYPELRVAMTATYRREDLLDVAHDLALRVGDVGDDRLVARPLAELHRVPVASPEFAARYRLRAVRDLARVPCLVFSGERAHAAWAMRDERTGRDEEVDVAGAIAVESFTTLLALARAGHGAAYLPAFVVERKLRDGSLVRCPPRMRSIPVPVFLAHRPGVERIARVRAVMELLSERVPAIFAESSRAPLRGRRRRA